MPTERLTVGSMSVLSLNTQTICESVASGATGHIPASTNMTAACCLEPLAVLEHIGHIRSSALASMSHGLKYFPRNCNCSVFQSHIEAAFRPVLQGGKQPAILSVRAATSKHADPCYSTSGASRLREHAPVEKPPLVSMPSCCSTASCTLAHVGRSCARGRPGVMAQCPTLELGARRPRATL